jgi:hypothetical protein
LYLSEFFFFWKFFWAWRGGCWPKKLFFFLNIFYIYLVQNFVLIPNSASKMSLDPYFCQKKPKTPLKMVLHFQAQIWGWRSFLREKPSLFSYLINRSSPRSTRINLNYPEIRKFAGKKWKKNEHPANTIDDINTNSRCSQEWHFKVATVWLISRRLLTPGIGCIWA